MIYPYIPIFAVQIVWDCLSDYVLRKFALSAGNGETRMRSMLLVGLDGLEPSTSVLSGPRSNRLSYRPPVSGVEKNRGSHGKL